MWVPIKKKKKKNRAFWGLYKDTKTKDNVGCMLRNFNFEISPERNLYVSSQDEQGCSSL